MKKKGKKLISIALTVAMIAGLTACGKGNGGNGNGGSSAADASLAKQYVFKEQALDLNMDSDNMNIDLLTKREIRFTFCLRPMNIPRTAVRVSCILLQ